MERLKAVEYYAQNKSSISSQQFFNVMSMMNNIKSDFNEEEWEVVNIIKKTLK